jgi:hypothetical protein
MELSISITSSSSDQNNFRTGLTCNTKQCSPQNCAPITARQGRQRNISRGFRAWSHSLQLSIPPFFNCSIFTKFQRLSIYPSFYIPSMLSTVRLASRAATRGVARNSIALRQASTWADVPQGPPVSHLFKV